MTGRLPLPKLDRHPNPLSIGCGIPLQIGDQDGLDLIALAIYILNEGCSNAWAVVQTPSRPTSPVTIPVT
jgi:hypothetical protein